jgi:hypothetical protein
VHINGTGFAHDIVKAAEASEIVDSFSVSLDNEGQHPPTNRAIDAALEGGYDYILRIDDDCKFLTRKWLARMVEAAEKLGLGFIISPTVKGLKNPMPTSTVAHKDDIPFVFIDIGYPMGGICRMIPTQMLRDKPYVSDVRRPLGLGDAQGIGEWAAANGFYCVYLKHVRVSHNTVEQESIDKDHFEQHALFQLIPYIAPWRAHGTE